MVALPNCCLFYTIFNSDNRCMLCRRVISEGEYGIFVIPNFALPGVNYPNVEFCFMCSGIVVACAALMEEAEILFVFCS